MAEKNLLSIVSFLAQTRFLGVLTLEELLTLAAEATSRSWGAKQVIFRQGDAGDRLYIIRAGTVNIVREDPSGQELTLALLYPGDMFGELAIIDGRDRSATAVAAEPVEAVTIERDHFLAFLGTRPEACLRVLKVLAGRLRRTDDAFQEAVFASAPTGCGQPAGREG